MLPDNKTKYVGNLGWDCILESKKDVTFEEVK